jgi:hypothetical protein
MASVLDEEKLKRLTQATEAARIQRDRCREALDRATDALTATKEHLKPHLTGDEQEHRLVNDTQLPELLQEQLSAQDAFDVAAKTYETNQRYLERLSSRN